MSAHGLLQPGEEIQAIVHRHWFFIVKETLIFSLIVLVPFLAAFIYGSLHLESVAPIPGSVTLFWIVVSLLWALLFLPFVFVVWTDYYLDTIVITDQRLIIVEQKGLFSREVQSFAFENVQDVVIEVTGIIASLLHFGTIHVQTAGGIHEFRTTYVPAPDKVKQQIFSAYDKLSKVAVGGV